MISGVLSTYGFAATDYHHTPFGNGLINTTWLVQKNDGTKFILQKINHVVFKTPKDIAWNIQLIKNYLEQSHPGYLFVAPLQTKDGEDVVIIGNNYYRLFPFIKGSHTIDVVQTPEQAYEAAKHFGRFTKLTRGFDAGKLKITLPDFHNISLRYQQFENALISGNIERINQSRHFIEFIQQHKYIANEFENIKTHFKIRCTHHDTKISNVLFDENDQGLCVIDLDTLMPGYFISDVGDMMRTYLSPVNEEEKDLSKIVIRPAFYKAVEDGYLSEMGEELTSAEKKSFAFAGEFMIYMQAMRFLTDHLTDDIYYGSKYEGHNYVRTANQITLLQRLLEFNPG